jgi:hypothetical protein
MTKVVGDGASKKRGGSGAARYPLAGVSILSFSAVVKLVPWWGALLLGALALVVALVQSVMPQESSDRAGVIREFLIFLMAAIPSLPRATCGPHQRTRTTSSKEIR